MRKIKSSLKRLGTLGLAAVLLATSVPEYAFAEELSDIVAEADTMAGSELTAQQDILTETYGSDIDDASVTEESQEPAGHPVSEDIGTAGADERLDTDAGKISYPAFGKSRSLGGVKITVEADEGVFPEGAVFSVEKVTKEQERKAEEAVEEKRSEDQNVAVSYTYDIKVLDEDGNEIQPADESKVNVSFKLEEVADENLETNIYHITESDASNLPPDGTSDSEQTKSLPLEGKGDHEAVDEVFVAEKLTVETNGDTATAETDGFSLYTVEFTYNDLQYVMPGDSEIALSEILDKVGLAGEVTEVSVSDSSLFSAEKNDSGEWIVTTHQSFNTNEWMKVTINDVVYEITVTDTNGTLSGEGTAENPYIIGSISDWNTFAANVTDGTESYEEKFVKLAADLGTEDAPVTTMAGNSDTNCFKGTFDGGGHTLTISLTADGNDCAPFRYATGATISFLHIKGTVNAGNHQYAAGFIGKVCTGAVTIKNCWSSVTINGDMSANYYKTAEHGGFVGELKTDSGLSLTITNCLFDGVINVTDGIYSAGFIGEVYGPKPKAELNNCLMTGEINEGSNNFVFWNKASQGARTTVTDCYYDGNKDYSSLTIQGTATTETGESLAGLLGNGWRVSEDTVIPVMDVYNLSGVTVEGVNEGGSYFYGGNAEGESVDYTVADLKGTVLKNGTHYSDMVLNSEGKIISKITSVGDYTLIITGMNPYYGTKIINFAVVTGADGYSYIDSAGNKKTTSVTGVITSENIPSTLTGWYIVQGDVSVDDRITVKGKANIILADGSSITAKSYIVNAGNTLNIYAQEEGTGKLSTSDAGDYYAGIGASGPYYGRKNCGNITINGGVITATGGMSAAAIGGTLDGNDGIVTINGGIINATGGKDAAAIGGGWRGHADVVINGGKITAIKSDEGTISCGIGSGTSGNGSTTVSLGWTRESDYIYSSGYTGSVSFQKGKVFVLDGTDTIATEGNIGGKKIVPASTDKLRLNMKNSKINGIAAAYNPNNSGIDLNYTVTDLTGTTLTKGTDYNETLTNDSTSAVVGKITGSGVYTLTVTGTGDENSGYYGSITSAIYVAGYKETLGGHEFTLTADEEGLYYPIDSEDALRALSSYVNNGGATSGKRFKQTENITLNGSFSPIGTGSSYKFQGTYDGGNKTISGLSLSGDVGFAALFGYICYATVKNVILISPNMSSSYYRSFNNTGSRVSALVGYMNTVTIDNCIVINPILNATGSGDNRVGVFIGEWGSNCSISNCCWYDSKAEHAYAPYENGDSIPAYSTAANIERVYKISASGCNTEAEGKVSIGGMYYLRKGTEVLVKASPSDGMWKFTAKGVTPSLTSKQGQYELTMPANDVTLGLAEVTPTIALSGGMVYDGEEKKPAITSVKDGDTTMTAGTDYTGVTYSNNINAGENTGVVSITGKGFYLGKATKSFTISPKPVTITGLSAENKIYDGSDTATVKGTASISGVRSGDAVSISAGTALFSDKNVGTNKTVTFSDYSLSGTESGNYVLSTQPTSVKANITPQTVTVESGITATDKTYDGNTAAILNCESAVLTGKVNGDELTVSATGAFEDANVGTNKNVNISGFTLGGADKDNYVLAESGHQTVATASISKKTAPDISEIGRTYLYTAGGQDSIDIAALLPADRGVTTYSVTTSGGVSYSADPAVTDGILTYTVNSGDIDKTGTITVKATTLNYTDITITVNVKLADQKPVELKAGTSVALNKNTLTYGEALSTLTFKTNTAVFVEQGNTSNVIAGTLAWKTPTAAPAAGTTSATWVFTPTDSAYADLEGNVAISVNKATPTVASIPTATAITYGQTLASSTLSDGEAKVGSTTVNGTFAWSDTTISPAVSDSGKTGYDVIFTPTDTDNYETAYCKVMLTVNKADIPSGDINAPTAKTGLTYTGSAQTLVNAGSVAGGTGTMKYAITKDNSAPEASAYASSIPTATDAGTFYVWYKVEGGANHNDAAAQSITVEIKKTACTEATEIASSTKYGLTRSVDLTDYIADGGTATVKSISDKSIFAENGAPALSGMGKTLTYSFKNDASLVESSATVKIDVKNATNYEDYELIVTLTVTNCDHSNTEIRNASSPSCTSTGYTGDTYCKDCDEKLSSGQSIPALGHSYDEGVVTKDPSTTEEGVKTFTCIRCGHSYTEAIPKLNGDLLLYEKVGKSYELRVSKKLKVGGSFTLVPKFADGRVLNQRVVWESSNPDVATVTQDGKVTARSGGQTTITVRSEEDTGLTAYCNVSVTESVTAVTLNRKSYTFGIGESVTLTATVLPFTAEQKLSWSANNGNVSIAESEDGLSVTVTAVKAGKAKVTAKAKDGSGKKAACSFTIGNPVPDFTIAGKGGASSLKAGKTLNMTVNWGGKSKTPKNAGIKWSVTASGGGGAFAIASISSKGVLTGITAGKVIVTATSMANPEKSASTEITVTAPAVSKGAKVTGISFTNTGTLTSNGLVTGKSFTVKTKLDLSGKGKAASDAVAWYSSDPSIATVSQKGVIKAVAPGTVTITAVTRDATDLSTAPAASVTFDVYAKVKSVKLDKTMLTIGTQDGTQYGLVSIASMVPCNARDMSIKWTAGNKNVRLAAVPAGANPSTGSFAEAGTGVTIKDGEALAVMGVAPGTVKLTGITTDGSKKKVICTVTIRGQVTGFKLKTVAAKKGVNDVTLADDSSTLVVEYTGIMKANSSMTLTPVIEINGLGKSKSTKKTYTTYKKYTDTSVSYRSSDTSVATVNKNGKITVKKGVASGKTVTIYVTSSDGKQTAQILITVN